MHVTVFVILNLLAIGNSVLTYLHCVPFYSSLFVTQVTWISGVLCVRKVKILSAIGFLPFIIIFLGMVLAYMYVL